MSHYLDGPGIQSVNIVAEDRGAAGKFCFKNLQGPSTTSLLRVNMHGDSLYSPPQAKQWELMSDSVAQSSSSQTSHTTKSATDLRCVSALVGTYPVTCSKLVK